MNLAVVGCGAIAARWMRVLTDDPRVRVIACADTDLALARRFAQRYAVDRAVSEISQLGGVDAVVNLTPPAVHPRVIRAALDRGWHVLTEKPVTVTAATAAQVDQLAHDAGRLVAVMHNRVLDPPFQPVRAAAAAARRPLLLSADVLVGLPAAGFRTELEHPVLTDLAVHAFDQVQALVDADPVAVSAHEVAVPAFGAHASLAGVTVTFTDGSVLAYRGGFTAAGLHTGGTGRWQLTDPGGPVSTAAPDEDAAPGYRQCLTMMLDLLHEPNPPTGVWPRQSLRSVQLMDAAVRSARTCTPVPVPGGLP